MLVASIVPGPGDASETVSSEPTPTVEESSLHPALRERLEVIERARAMVVDKRDHRAAVQTARARALYRVARVSGTRPWVEREARRAGLERSVVAAFLRRDARELRKLDEELARIDASRDVLLSAPVLAATPAPRSLFRPVVRGKIVRHFGPYRDPKSGARLSSRGVEFATKPGRNVRAVADGVIAYSGEIRGIGHAVLIKHGDEGGYWSLTGNLDPATAVVEGAQKRGEVVGQAIGDRVVLEVRVAVGLEGLPIDPAPLLLPR